ncbi:ion channel [Quadrisphaera sp. DSM 44207]|uniref:ion channel n=1 Tax=Quadrisphaera sp. DSM 44207 TaxID=1881057 RepID=UPI00087F7526|nr:ion channel [Quadrisphaera sp. DSM 44207]SDQ78602.1 voltage-gated potassium channel [Quadrisphaera sp. DSM 44207]
MPFLLLRLSRYLRHLTGWRLPLVIIGVVFATSWLAMWLVEPGEITEPGNYWWYFVVTAATVGYGDFFPQTAAGHVVGAYVIVGGIVTLTLLFTRLADRVQSIRGTRMRGLAPLDLQGHVVVLGYAPGHTERIVAELTAEDGLRVALCAWDDVVEHPLPERPAVSFVRGDLGSADVMRRAGVARARTVVVDGRDDDESLTITVAVHHAAPDVHTVVALRDLDRREHIGYVDPRIQCVQWHMPFLITEEALDPGITQVYHDLMRSGGHGNTYSLPLPARCAGSSFGEVQTRFGRSFGATVLAVRTGDGLVVSPPWDRALARGDVLYYVAAQRLDADTVLHALR